jgi:hypothetical protein
LPTPDRLRRDGLLLRLLPYGVTALVLSVLYHRTLLPSTGNSSDTAKFVRDRKTITFA